MPAWNQPTLTFTVWVPLSWQVSLTLRFGSKKKKKKTTPARSFQGICQAGRISGTPKMLLSPPNLNTCDPQDLLVGFVVEEHFLTEHSAQLSTKPNLKATRSWECSSAKGLSGAQIRPSGKGEIITRGSSQGSKRAPLLTHQGGRGAVSQSSQFFYPRKNQNPLSHTLLEALAPQKLSVSPCYGDWR